MKFMVSRSTDWSGDEKAKVELNSLEDLIEYAEKSGHPLILHAWKDEELELEIYDGWRE